MSVSVLVIGDLHLNGLIFLEDYVEDPDDMIYQALDGVVAYAKENGIKYLIILGDIFDHPDPSQESQKRLLRYLNSIGLSVHIISGNHDITSEGHHSLVMSEFYTDELKGNVHIYTKPKLVKMDDISVCFLPWPHIKPLTKKACLNIAHVTLNKARSDEGRQLEGVEARISKKQFWAIGDLHTHQVYSKRAIYVGMMYQKTFGEMGPKGFLHLDLEVVNGQLKADYEFVITKPPYELVKLKVDEVGDFNKLQEYNNKDIVLYKLKLGPNIIVPANIRQKYPNIIDIDYGSSKIKTTKNKTISFKGVKNPLEGLKGYLLKEGLSIKEVNQGLRYSKAWMKEIRDE